MRRGLLALLAAAAVAGAGLLPGAAGAVGQAGSLTLYGKPTKARYSEHSDDRQRGDIKNPFTIDVLPTPKNANSGRRGARAGDMATISVKLFADARMTRTAGTAIYSCTFNFAEEAVCQIFFSLGGSTMIASGPAHLDGVRMVLPVTGGTGRYLGARGQMTSTPVGDQDDSQVYRFRLL